MLEGCSQCCVPFVRIVLSVPCWHAYHPWSGSRPTRGQRIFPVSEWYPRVCLHAWKWQGDKTLCDLWPCKPGLPCGFLSTVGEVWCYVAAGECMKEQHSFGNLRTQCNGNLMDRDVSEILTSSECYPELLNVCKPWKWATATTTTSVPTVLMVTDFKPQFMGSLTWRSIRMYASSCEHGWSPSVLWHSCPRNRKSSSSCHHFVRSLFFQFPGSLAWLDTRLRVPVPLFALVASFRLSFMYTSQTRSTRWVYPVPKTHVGWIRPFPIRRRFSIPRLEKYSQHHPGLLLQHAGYSRDSLISTSLEESN